MLALMEEFCFFWPQKNWPKMLAFFMTDLYVSWKKRTKIKLCFGRLFFCILTGLKKTPRFGVFWRQTAERPVFWEKKIL